MLSGNTFKNLITLKSVLVGALFTTSALAETITVEPGVGTINRAISEAEAGDVLILQDGNYQISGTSSLVIDKSLTIRAINKSASPLMAFNCTSCNYPTITIEGEETDFILQGVNLRKLSTGYRVPYLTLKGVRSAAFLQNNLSMNFSQISEIHQDGLQHYAGDVLFVGNQISAGSMNSVGGESNFLFAGNEVHSLSPNFTTYGPDAHIIGNKFTHDSNMFGLSASMGSKYFRVIGNVFEHRLSNMLNRNVGSTTYGIVSLSYSGEFKNNIVKFGTNPLSSIGLPNSIRALYVNGDKWDISNNIFDNKLPRYIDGDQNYPESFHILSSVNFTNNIIVNTISDEMLKLGSADAVTQSKIGNNLCFNNVADCPEGSLIADPKFVDDVNYLLADGSPAVDAGVISDAFKDLDGSTIDLGAYGGSFPIGQFTEQRYADNVKPFVYPLFEANSNLSNTGELRVKAVAVAKHR